MYEIYTIAKGDTIESIAKKFNTSPEILRSINANNNFTVGTNIIVPKVNEYFDIYTVEKGDTLYEIAKKYNTDYNLLALLNGLNVNDYIYPSNTILVPKKDVKYYITKDNDTFGNVNRILNSDISKLIKQNNLYLKEGQLIVYKD